MNKKKIIAVIPARMGATRFPGKPLVKILDLPMIEHVRRRVELCDIIDEVCVATCDEVIKEVVDNSGGRSIMTADTHERCTERVEEAVRTLEGDIVIIFQGDEPIFDLKIAEQLVEPMVSDENILCINLLSTIKKRDDLSNTNIVKTILNQYNEVLYFSRSAIPHIREDNDCPLYRQTGLSAFRIDFLRKYVKLTPTPLEITESVDFLRILEHGFKIKGIIFDRPMYGVDEPDHVATIEEILKNDQNQAEIYEKILQLQKSA